MTSENSVGPISVIISTVGRPYFLAALLASIELHAPPDSEILVINNRRNSGHEETLNAQRVLLKISKRCDVRFLTMTEKGVAAARNFGATHATCEVIHFLDDECLVTSDTYGELSDFISSGQTLAFGGYVPLHLEHWHDYVSSNEILRQRTNPTQRDFIAKVAGGNLFVRRSEFLKLGGFREHLGRGSGYIEVGEEPEFAQRVVNSGSELFFMANSIVFHGERPSRTRLWALKNYFQVGRFRAYSDRMSVSTSVKESKPTNKKKILRRREIKFGQLVFFSAGYFFQRLKCRSTISHGRRSF